MKYIIILLLVLITNNFANDKEVTAYLNGISKKIIIKDGKDFYYKCIDNYQWIQFVSCSDNNICTEQGNPIQQFEKSTLNDFDSRYRQSSPVFCGN